MLILNFTLFSIYFINSNILVNTGLAMILHHIRLTDHELQMHFGTETQF